jgi:tungstate transport system substrate-binding protein
MHTTAVDKNMIIRLTTTTSIVSSGLLEQLKTAFEADTGFTLEVEAFGTGRALRRAREGNADVVIVHSPVAEQKFMQAGYGLVRLALMKNAFILAGPKADPAAVANFEDIVSAFKAIAGKQERFVSRGDDSGTHKKELEIWYESNIEPYGKWYIEYGQGMGKTLFYADEMNAYILVDKGTWLARRKQLKLVQLFDNDELLDNPYHIISVNPDKHPLMNKECAQRFVAWMTSKRGQDIIRNFTIDDEQLFTPAGNS